MKCLKELPATKEFFHVQKMGKFGLRSKCKECCKEYKKKYASTDEYKKRHREYMAKWRADNPEKALEIQRKNYRINGHKHNEKRKYRYENEPEFKAKIIEREKKYQESGRRLAASQKPEQKEKARKRNYERRKVKELREHDYKIKAKYRKENQKAINEMHKKRREMLVPSYVAQIMRIPVSDLTPEILETKQLIIKLRRELKKM